MPPYASKTASYIPYTPRNPPMPPDATLPLLAPEYLQSLPAPQYTPYTPYTTCHPHNGPNTP